MRLEDITIEENDDYLIINKPAGLVVHYSHLKPLENTLAMLVQDKVEDDGSSRAGIVHRLDKNTSGLMIIAKNIKFRDHIIHQFKTHLVKKKYIGLVHGRLEHTDALIDLPISRDPIRRHKMKVLPSGKTSKTIYKVIASNGKYSLVDLNLLTGRTHQIRLHLSHIKHPIVGDSIYAPSKNDSLDRYFLQSYYIEFQDLAGQDKKIAIDLDNQLKAFLEDHEIGPIDDIRLLAINHLS
jgi:23S rRNA pseudouridine1911/1915/1917 synthase